MDFDPLRISYADLLAVFWDSHEPSHGSWSRQYRAAVFYHNNAQKRLAEETRDRVASRTGREVRTAIEPYAGFYLAEDYHQKHGLRMFHQLLLEYKAIYPDMRKFINSTAVTRVNGYLGGYGSCGVLQKEIERLGLSCAGRESLLSTVCGRRISLTCQAR